MYKRSVIGTATLTPMLRKQNNGIPDKLKIAIFRDPSEVFGNIHGDTEKFNIWDGGVFLNGIHAK